VTFLEQRRDIFLSIFKGLVQDSYPVVLRILEHCWSGILADLKLKRTLKISLFNESTITQVCTSSRACTSSPDMDFRDVQIVKLYDRAVPEGHPDHIPADLAHHFLLALCTRPGTGVCFKDRGWYPRGLEASSAQDEEDPQTQRGGKVYNKILANILRKLKINEDLRQQELALKILAACPELSSGCVNLQFDVSDIKMTLLVAQVLG